MTFNLKSTMHNFIAVYGIWPQSVLRTVLTPMLANCPEGTPAFADRESPAAAAAAASAAVVLACAKAKGSYGFPVLTGASFGTTGTPGRKAGSSSGESHSVTAASEAAVPNRGCAERGSRACLARNAAMSACFAYIIKICQFYFFLNLHFNFQSKYILLNLISNFQFPISSIYLRSTKK